MEYLEQLLNTFETYNTNNALCINETFYTYNDLKSEVLKICYSIENDIEYSQKNIGLITNNDIYTYAAIIALWLEGKAYVPISPDSPMDRNCEILKNAKTKYILDSTDNNNYVDFFNVINITNLKLTKKDLNSRSSNINDIAYILFTSGSTGIPKGVQITFSNLNSLIKAMHFEKKHKILPNDKCLQMFELTFDYSLVTFLYPLLFGACIYTIPKNQIKYLYVYKLIQKFELTYLVLTSSIITYLRPYFKEINAKKIRYCCFGAAPLDLNLALEWKKCIPNAKLFNSYGPTEFTVTTTYYSFENVKVVKTKNGIVALGKVMNNIDAVIINENNEILGTDKEGELCLSGNQLTIGYWNNDKENKKSFINIKTNGSTKKFYKTGDLCTIDKDKDIMFIGRKDFQVKIRGYRVELGEIEYHIKCFTTNINIAIIDVNDNNGNNEIALVIEKEEHDTTALFNYLQTKVPNYMMPTKTHFLDQLPHNINGKLDRKELKNWIKNTYK